MTVVTAARPRKSEMNRTFINKENARREAARYQCLKPHMLRSQLFSLTLMLLHLATNFFGAVEYVLWQHSGRSSSNSIMWLLLFLDIGWYSALLINITLGRSIPLLAWKFFAIVQLILVAHTWADLWPPLFWPYKVAVVLRVVGVVTLYFFHDLYVQYHYKTFQVEYQRRLGLRRNGSKSSEKSDSGNSGDSDGRKRENTFTAWLCWQVERSCDRVVAV
jgi:hypothetical protein